MEPEIHCQAGDVVDAVEVAQGVVRVEAIEDTGSVRQAEDVVGDQVAVTVDDTVVRETMVEQRPAPREIGPHPGVDEKEIVLAQDISGGGGDGPEAVSPASGQRISSPGGVDGVAEGTVGMHCCHQFCDAVDVMVQIGAGLGQRGQPGVRGHAPHRHQGFAHAAVEIGQFCHSLVDIGREPRVQRDLASAGCPPGRSRGQIEERCAHRLLHLVDAVTECHHVGRERLVHLPPHRRRRWAGRCRGLGGARFDDHGHR